LLMEALLPALHIRLADVWRVLGALKFWRWGLRNDGGDSNITVVTGAGRVHQALQLPQWMVAGIAAVYACCVLYFAVRLGWGLWKTRRMQREAEPAELTDVVANRWTQQSRSAGVEAAVLVSAMTHGPATVGIWRRALVIPPEFFTGMGESELDAVMAHESAHMRRHDFTKNIFYSVAALPVAYHPLLWMTSSRLKESREMVCDAIAAEAVAGRERYARSLLRLASMLVENEPVRTIHAIGIFDVNTWRGEL